MRKQKMTETVALSESWKNEIFANFLRNFYRIKSSLRWRIFCFFLTKHYVKYESVVIFLEM